MKHYRRFRVFCEVAHLVLAVVAVGAFIYFIWQFLPLIPIYE